MKNYSLVKVDWSIEPIDESKIYKSHEITLDLDNRNYNYRSDEVSNPVEISIQGLDTYIDEVIKDNGGDIIDELAVPFIIDKINKELNPPKFIKGEIYDILLSAKWKKPSFGEFILVFDVGGYGPDHNGEYDSWIDCVGILGDQVKLTIEK